MSNTRKFYELSARERIDILKSEGIISSLNAQTLDESNRNAALDSSVAAHLIENQISQFVLPLGIIKELRVNGQNYCVPLVTEEPSVVAAASNGARIVAQCGGISAHSEPYRVRGEIVFESEYVSEHEAQKLIISHEKELRDCAQRALPRIYQRGGGVESISVESTEDKKFTKVVVSINPCDAMGANAVNTIVEALKVLLSQWFNSQVLVAILSNAGNQSVTAAHVELTPEAVGSHSQDAEKLVRRIATLSDLAQSDYERAVTHNKGIMNGISAAVLASGNDTRAVEACAHAYASRSGTYQPLALWSVNSTGNLCGHIEIPFQLGVVGGAANSLPMARIVREIGHYSSVDELRNVLAAVGLVQNLAALRALAGPGIQAGHMNLHMNTLAVSAGAHGDEIDAIAQQLRQLPMSERTSQSAHKLLAQLRKQSEEDLRNE